MRCRARSRAWQVPGQRGQTVQEAERGMQVRGEGQSGLVAPQGVSEAVASGRRKRRGRRRCIFGFGGEVVGGVVVPGLTMDGGGVEVEGEGGWRTYYLFETGVGSVGGLEAGDT